MLPSEVDVVVVVDDWVVSVVLINTHVGTLPLQIPLTKQVIDKLPISSCP